MPATAAVESTVTLVEVLDAEKLNEVEQKEFTRQRRVAKREFERGRKAWLAMIAALKVMSDRKLFREEFASFDEFCAAEFGYGENYGYKLIAAARVAEVCTSVQIEPPQSEAVARPLASLPDEEIIEVWKSVQEAAEAEGRQPTAAEVAESPIYRAKRKGAASKGNKNLRKDSPERTDRARLLEVMAILNELPANIGNIDLQAVGKMDGPEDREERIGLIQDADAALMELMEALEPSEAVA